MLSVRTKLILLICVLTAIVDALSCLFLIAHEKSVQKEVIRKLGMSLITLLAQDNEVELAMSHGQLAFLDMPIKRTKAFDREEEIGYWRISNIKEVMLEERVAWVKIDMREIPDRKDLQDTDKQSANRKWSRGGAHIIESSQNLDVPISNQIIISSGEEFYDFSAPVFEKQPFSEEAFATQILDEDKIPLKTKRQLLGFVQIGLSTRKLNEKIYNVIWQIVTPMGISIFLGGICITYLINRYIASPLRRMADITLDIARGELAHTIPVQSKDEIGQLSVNFNQMTKSLKTSYDDLKQEIAEHKSTEELLKYRVEMEELIATISANFINLAPEDVDIGINRALEIIGKFVDVDRSYVCLYADNEKKKMDNTHEWCAEGIEPQIENLKEVPVEYFSWGMETLNRFETIHVPRVVGLPDCANAEKELQQSQGVQSFVVVPMVYSGGLVGFLGFDSVKEEKTWTDEDIALLKIAGEIFVNALEHRRKAKMLQKAYDSLEVRVKERTAELIRINKLMNEEIAEHKKAREELEKYEILISQITDLPYICDTNGNILFVNHMFERLTGHKREEFLGESFAPLFNDENMKKAIDVYRRTLKGESPQYELYFKDTGVLCEYKNLPLRDENGNIVGVIGTARDITERRRMEDELRKTNQTLNALIQASPLAISVIDSNGHVKMWNPSAERIFGWKEQEVIGKILPIIPKDKLDEHRGYRDRALRGESFMGIEVLRQKRDGSLINISLSVAPLYGTNGDIEGIVGILADITERQKMIEALRQAKDYAENLIETANVMVIGLDIEGNIQVFNKTAEEITGYKKSEIIGKNWFEVIVPKYKYPFVWQEFLKLKQGIQLPKSLENQILTKAGKIRYISWQNSEVREQGKLTGTISFGSDITEQKRMHSLVERMRLTAFVRDISIALTQGDTLHDILCLCTESIVHNLDAAFARIWTLKEGENILELQASSGMYINIDGAHSRIPLGKLKIGLIAQGKQPYFTNSFTEDPQISDRDWAKREGIAAFAGYPLIVEDRLVGVVAMFSRKTLTDFTLKALESVADIIAVGVDRKCAEEALRESENRYRILLENLPQRVFHKDKNLNYMYCNENYAQDLKIKPIEIFGKTDYDFYPKELADKYRSDDRRILASGKTEEMDEKYIKDGKELIVHTVKTSIKDEKGNIIGILGIFWDITEKMAMQMEAIRTRHLASLGELAAGVAHEINNPITGIINYSQILVNKSTKGSNENNIANRIIKEGDRIAGIVKNLLSFARSGDRKENKSSVNVPGILADTVTLIEVQLKKEGIQASLNISRKLPEIIAHPQQIQQVFLNIISNARYALNQKYPGMHDNKILEITGEEITVNNHPYVKVTFYDHGTGIPANIIDKVMNPFFTTKPVGKGTGLGLSISHGIVSEHGGKLTIDSVEGKYTKVTISLPTIKLT